MQKKYIFRSILLIWSFCLLFLCRSVPEAWALEYYWGQHPDKERLVFQFSRELSLPYTIKRIGPKEIILTLCPQALAQEPGPETTDTSPAKILDQIALGKENIHIQTKTSAFGYVHFELADQNKLVLDFFQHNLGSSWSRTKPASQDPPDPSQDKTMHAPQTDGPKTLKTSAASKPSAARESNFAQLVLQQPQLEPPGAKQTAKQGKSYIYRSTVRWAGPMVAGKPTRTKLAVQPARHKSHIYRDRISWVRPVAAGNLSLRKTNLGSAGKVNSHIYRSTVNWAGPVLAERPAATDHPGLGQTTAQTTSSSMFTENQKGYWQELLLQARAALDNRNHDLARDILQQLLQQEMLKINYNQILELVLNIYLQNQAWTEIQALASQAADKDLPAELNSRLQYARALAMENLQQQDKSFALWQKLAEEDSLKDLKGYAYYFLTRNALEHEKWEKVQHYAHSALSTFLEQEPQETERALDCLDMLIESNRRSGRSLEALKWAWKYQELIAQDSKMWPAHKYRLAELYQQAGDQAGWQKTLQELQAEFADTRYGQLAALALAEQERAQIAWQLIQ